MNASNTKPSYSSVDQSPVDVIDEASLRANSVDAMHRAIEGRWAKSPSNPPSWEDFCDPMTHEDRLIQMVSRACGIVGMLIGLAGAGALVSVLI